MPALVPRSLAILSFFTGFSLIFLYLASTALRIFKQALSDKFLYSSTSFAEFFYPFPPLGLLSNKTDCKQTFDIAFINFCLFVGNYA